jgi:hypothetical protein
LPNFNFEGYFSSCFFQSMYLRFRLSSPTPALFFLGKLRCTHLYFHQLDPALDLPSVPMLRALGTPLLAAAIGGTGHRPKNGNRMKTLLVDSCDSCMEIGKLLALEP